MERSDYERVLGVARRLATSDDLETVLGEIIDAMRDVLRAERASVFTYECPAGGGGAGGSFVAARAHGLDRSFRVSAGEGVIGRAARTGRVVNVSDVTEEACFSGRVDAATGFRTRCLLAVPMSDATGELVGVVQVLNKVGGGVFGAADEAVAEHLAAQAGVALRRAALMEAARRREVLEAEVGAARAMQKAAMPGELVGLAGWAVDASWEPASGGGGAAGDVYDAVVVDGGGRLVFMLADASGHGVGPAVSVSRVQAMFRMGVRAGMGLCEVAGVLDEQLSGALPAGHFVTAMFGEVEAGCGVVRWVSSGQGRVVIVVEDGRSEVVGPGSPPLGLGGGRRGGASVVERAVGVGGGLVVASDGVYEGAGALREAEVSRVAFGAGGAAGVIAACGGAGEDDRTVLVVRRMG